MSSYPHHSDDHKVLTTRQFGDILAHKSLRGNRKNTRTVLMNITHAKPPDSKILPYVKTNNFNTSEETCIKNQDWIFFWLRFFWPFFFFFDSEASRQSDCYCALDVKFLYKHTPKIMFTYFSKHLTMVLLPAPGFPALYLYSWYSWLLLHFLEHDTLANLIASYFFQGTYLVC